MMYYFHKDKKLYFEHQRLITSNYIIPFIENHLDIKPGMHVLEIGCGEAGVLKAFTDRGCIATGVDIDTEKIEIAKKFMEYEIINNKIILLNSNIHEKEFHDNFESKFDLIILKDVIEHIANQKEFLQYLHNFTTIDGKIFFGFPPWHMPFGGHQQICESKALSTLPYFHLLPMNIYKNVLKVFGENEEKIEQLTEIKQTGISIEHFEKIVSEKNFTIVEKNFFLFNPIYKYKFNIEAKEQYKIIQIIPFLRNFLTTCAYYLIESHNSPYQMQRDTI